MALIVKDDGGGDFSPCPEGQNQAVCTQIIELGTQHNEQFNKDQRLVLFGLELPTVLNADNDNKPFMIWQRYTMNLGSKANLRKDLETWRGVAFTDEQLDGFDLKKVLGAPCYIGVIHKVKGDKTYANLNSIIKLPKEITPRDPVGPLVYFEIGEPDLEAFDTFSNNLQATICRSPEAQAVGLTPGCTSLSPPPRTAADHGEGGTHDPICEEDIPFTPMPPWDC